MLDQRLQQHRSSGGDRAPDASGAKRPAPEWPPAEVPEASMPVPSQPKAGSSSSYWPARHSGARAVLVLLHREHLNPSGHSCLTKEELLQRCAQEFPRVAPGSTGPWPALRSLLHRNLVYRTHQPARYSLTPQGLELAQKLAESEGLSSLNVRSGPEEPSGEEPEVPGSASAELGASEGSVQQPPLELRPGEYRVLLCVDVGEAKGAGHRPELLRQLQRLHVTHMVRKLHVGDFVWVAQETRPRDPCKGYSLTPQGLELAQKLAESEGLSSLNVRSGPEEPSGEEPEVPGSASAELGASEGSVQQPPLELRPGEYRVLLCVDVGEAKGAGHRPELLRQLQRLHVTHMVRKLHVGDFVWVAQETRPRDPSRPGELVLDHIVERKRLDDLCSSIIDGRFREQKFRLKRCGLGRRVYLVEEHGSVHNLSLPESTLLQAVTNTQVIDGFFVKRTADIKESAAYLALLTRGLERLYQGYTLRSRPWGTSGDPESGSGPSPNPLCSLLTFNDFNAGAIKNKAQSVREVFARQLMQVRGVSGEKAAALVDRYSTPASLLAAYDACATPKEQEMLLSTVKCGQLQRNLGPALSRTLSQLYCSYGPLT
ncbi:Crossover junction endonuclease MUS81 [Myotis davidii]|uniref:Crossover junction endonuclease MUS81 n=1 Tax=Myotis davidii TaxID=225400 RepID=L5LEL9_MYODS|nr:Crossover junction endonuclease MUS81 [Myotis davidii]